MSKDTKEVKVEAKVTSLEAPKEELKTVEVKKEEVKKTEYRRPEMVYRGRLHIDEKYKKPGKVQRIVRANSSRIQDLEYLGYTVVTDETKVGTGALSEPGSLGSAATIDAGLHGKSDLHIIMECDQDVYDQRQAEKAKANDAQLQSSKQHCLTNKI
jgi:hypothetical protein